LYADPIMCVILRPAVTPVVKVGRFVRFAHLRELLGYSGAVSGEHSTGGETEQSAATS